MGVQNRGSIAFFATYRPPVPFDIYSKNLTNPSEGEKIITDGGYNYNYNGQAIPSSALKTIVGRLETKELVPKDMKLKDKVDSGQLWGLIFVSERAEGLETLHIGLFQDQEPKIQVFNLAKVYDTFEGVTRESCVRMEDSGCVAGNYLIYVSTVEPANERHQPWTAVFRLNLQTGENKRLTPKGIADMSPSVSPDGKRIAVASLEGKKGGWCGEIEDLRTNIFIMDVEEPSNRELVVVDGGWPTWGSNNVIFFHRNIEKVKMNKLWCVFRIKLDEGTIARVTPKTFSAMTPAAIGEDKVVVATMRERFTFAQDERTEDQYRHIETFTIKSTENETFSQIGTIIQNERITRYTRSKADHFNPFIVVDDIVDDDQKGRKIKRGMRICYHRCNTDKVKAYNVVEKKYYELQSPVPDVEVFRVPGVFPSISSCGQKLAFVDNEFKAVWVADCEGLKMVYQANVADKLFSPVWNTQKDTLYVCEGPAFNTSKTVVIVAIMCVTSPNRKIKWLTDEGHNSAFPSNDPSGTRLVYRSTRGEKKNKNLYIMEDAELGEFDGGIITPLTQGTWTDTQCNWSPNGNWIAFSSNRDNATAEKPQDLPDPGYFGVYLVKADDKDVVVKVLDSGFDYKGELFPGHVNHPIFSPDGKSLVVTADLAAVSCEPISMPLFVHSVRPYGDVFVIDIDPVNIENNKDVKNEKYKRITHSKYENATATWTKVSAKQLQQACMVSKSPCPWASTYEPACPFVSVTNPEAESVHMTGHICIPRRCC